MTSELMVKEMETLSVLRHPNIVLLMATCCGPAKHTLFLVLEPLMTSSLFYLLHKSEHCSGFGHKERLTIACGVTSG